MIFVYMDMQEYKCSNRRVDVKKFKYSITLHVYSHIAIYMNHYTKFDTRMHYG